jgi:hypothetical protein
MVHYDEFLSAKYCFAEYCSPDPECCSIALAMFTLLSLLCVALLSVIILNVIAPLSENKIKQ